MLDTVSDYIIEARRLLQDQAQPYRYQDSDIVAALNLCQTEITRIRWDIIVDAYPTLAIPTFVDTATSDPVPIDIRYRMPVLYYIVGNVQLRDDEATQDARAAALLKQFVGQMTQAAA